MRYNEGMKSETKTSRKETEMETRIADLKKVGFVPSRVVVDREFGRAKGRAHVVTAEFRLASFPDATKRVQLYARGSALKATGIAAAFATAHGIAVVDLR